MTMNFRSQALLFVALSALIAGCGDKQAATNPARPTSSPTSNQPHAGQTKAPAGNPGTPLGDYKGLSSGDDLMAHYFRLSGGVPDDLSEVAKYHHPAYQREDDAFKKRDLLAQFKQSVQARVEAVKQSPYVVIDLPDYTRIGRGALGSYDFEKKAFLVGYFEKQKVYKSPQYDIPSSNQSKDTGVDLGNKITFLDNSFSSLYFSNWKDFEYLTVADEAMARDLEAKRNQYRMSDDKGLLRVRIYAFVNDLVGSRALSHRVASNAVIGQIMKLQLLDLDGKVVAEK